MRVPLLITILLAALPAAADESEASLTLEAGPSFIHLEDVQNTSAMATVAGGGGALGLSYGLSDFIAADLSVGGFVAENAEFHGVMTDLGNGNVLQDILGLRVTAGASARFGAHLIPTFGLRAGYQHRSLSNAVLFNDQRIVLASLPSRSTDEILASASAGLELRLDRHWLVGISAQVGYVFGAENDFIAIEIPVRMTYSFYPGWFRSSRVTRFDE